MFGGIDCGASKSIVAIAQSENALSAKIIRNNLENDNTPTVVALTPSQFLVGELAVDQIRIAPKNAIIGLPNLIGVSKAAFESAHGVPPYELMDGMRCSSSVER